MKYWGIYMVKIHRTLIILIISAIYTHPLFSMDQSKHYEHSHKLRRLRKERESKEALIAELMFLQRVMNNSKIISLVHCTQIDLTQSYEGSLLGIEKNINTIEQINKLLGKWVVGTLPQQNRDRNCLITAQEKTLKISILEEEAPIYAILKSERKLEDSEDMRTKFDEKNRQIRFELANYVKRLLKELKSE